MMRLIYISNGETFTGKNTEWDVVANGVMPARCAWHQIFIVVKDDKATQISYTEAEKMFELLTSLR